MKDAARILIVDDDPEIREILRVLLESEGFAAAEAADGAEALAVFSEKTDLVILDVMMPGLSGYEVCRKMRERSNVPILFLTAKNQEADLTLGFSTGADDYLAKPFSTGELLARVKGLLRRYHTYRGRSAHEEKATLEWGGLVLRQDSNDVRKNGRRLTLTDKEYQILKMLLASRGKTFSAQMLYEGVWGEPFHYSSNNTVMVHIRHLREKIEDDPQAPTLLKTVWGKGYRIE